MDHPDLAALARENQRLRDRLAAVERAAARQQAVEAALRDSRERYRLLIESFPDAVVLYDPDGRVVYVNQAFVDTYGWQREEWLGRKIDFVPPEETEKTRNAIDRVLAGEDLVLETRRNTRDGRTLDVRIRPAPFRAPDGELLGVYVIHRDVTEKKRRERALRESEERYRKLLDASPDPISVYDARGKVTYVNPAFQETFGWGLEELAGRGIDFVPPHEVERTRDAVRRTLAGETVLLETQRLTKDGRLLDIQLKTTIFHNDDGSLAGDIVIYRDVTTLKHAQRELARHQDHLETLVKDRTRELEAANERLQREIRDRKRLEVQLLQSQKMEALGTLAGGIAHDFRNLLQVIHGYAETLLRNRTADDPERTDLQKVLRAARRGADLTSQLLTFSRRMDVELRPLDLNREVREIATMLRRTIPRMVDLELALADTLVAVEGDPGQIEQALLNLALNAKDAMPDGGRLTIATGVGDGDGDLPLDGPTVWLEVRDTGHGMTPDLADHIFDPFFTTKAVGQGTGLGLSTVYGIVRGHGGHITCRSQPGAGTAFRIHLPRYEGPLPAPADPAAAEAAVSAGATGTVLVVDDEPEIRDLARMFLEKDGFEVATASSGEEALDTYRLRGDIDLVVLDLGMPGMGGRACLRRLLETDPDARVLVATGYASDGQAAGILEDGARALINKPYRARDLVARVREILERP